MGVASRGIRATRKNLIALVASAPILATTLVLIATTLLAAGCTLDDGEPWGYVDAKLSVHEPYVDESFELTSFDVDIEEVHLLALDDSPGAEPTGGDCHGEHCHGATPNDDEPHTEESGEREVAHFELHEPITSLEVVSLGEAAITERVEIERVDSEIHELVIEGVLTRDGVDIPTTIHLEHILLSGDVHVSFGPDSPEHQDLHLALWWAEPFFEDIDVDQLETDANGHIEISHDANHEAAEVLSSHLAESQLRYVSPIVPH